MKQVFLAAALGLAPAVFPGLAAAQDVVNWQVQCAAASRSAPLVCVSSQTLVDAERKTALMRASVSVSPEIEGDTHALINVEIPPGVHIPSGVQLGEQPLDLVNCDGRGCFAQGTFDGPLMQAFMAGGTQDVHFRNANGQDITLTLTLDGFAESFEKIALTD